MLKNYPSQTTDSNVYLFLYILIFDYIKTPPPTGDSFLLKLLDKLKTVDFELTKE